MANYCMIEPITNWRHQDDNRDETHIPLCTSRYPVNGKFDVYYDEYMDGGGTLFAQSLRDVVRYLYPTEKINHCLEWCSGPGFFGFQLLADDICEHVTFMDVYLPSILAINRTQQSLPMDYVKRTSTVCSGNLQNLSDCYDLVVSNPPWYSTPKLGNSDNRNRIAVDVDWQLRQHYFSNLKRILSPNGIAISLESVNGSSPESFERFIPAGVLEIKFVLKDTAFPNNYYLVVGHA